MGGVVKGASDGLGLHSLARDLGLDLSIELHTDSSAALGICWRTGIGRVRHLAVGQLWVQERLRAGEFRLYKVDGTENPADLLTKHLAAASVGACLRRLSVGPEGGRAASSPAVATDVQRWLLPP